MHLFYQSQVKDYQRDAEADHVIKEELTQQLKELEKKIKAMEADVIQSQEDLANSERIRRAVEAEKDELQEEINTNASRR